MIIPIPDWSPDSAAMTPGLNGAQAATVENIVPSQAGWRVIREWTEITTGTTVTDGADISGAFSAKDEFRTVDYAGDTAKLYAYDSVGNAINDISSGVYTTQTGDFWDFTQYGTLVIAANGGQSAADVLQVVDTTAAVGTAAAALGGTPPKAATIDALREFVVLGHTYDATDGERVGRVWWSGFGDQTQWVPSAATQCDFQDLKSSVGAVQRVLGGDDAFIVCQNGVYTMNYVGPPTLMRFDLVYPAIGTIYPRSCVRVGSHLYMYSKAGFVRLNTQGGSPEWIGAGIVNDSFYQDLLAASGGTIGDRLQVSGAHDPFNQVIWWTFGASGAAYGFSYAFNKWCFASLGPVPFYYTSDIGYTATNTRIPTIYGFNTVTDKLFGAVGADAANYEASSGYYQFNPGRRTLVNRVRPIVEHETDPGTMKLNTFTYNNAADDATFNNVAQSNLNLNANDGHFDVDTEGRFINLHMTVTASQGEQHIYGFDVESAAMTGKF